MKKCPSKRTQEREAELGAIGGERGGAARIGRWEG
jgi:hypothetical protein